MDRGAGAEFGAERVVAKRSYTPGLFSTDGNDRSEGKVERIGKRREQMTAAQRRYSRSVAVVWSIQQLISAAPPYEAAPLTHPLKRCEISLHHQNAPRCRASASQCSNSIWQYRNFFAPYGLGFVSSNMKASKQVYFLACSKRMAGTLYKTLSKPQRPQDACRKHLPSSLKDSVSICINSFSMQTRILTTPGISVSPNSDDARNFYAS